MILLQAGGTSTLPSILFATLILLIVWRIFVAIIRATRSSDSKPTQKKGGKLERRNVMNFFRLHTGEVKKYEKSEQNNLAWLGAKHVAIFGGIYALVFLIIGLIYATAKWLWNGWQSTFPVRTILVALLIGLAVLLIYLILYWLAYTFYKDFKFLMEGVFVIEEDAKFQAFQQAAQIHPSEYAFTMLAQTKKHMIRNSKEAWNGNEWDFELDYSPSFHYLNEAIQLNPKETSPYIWRAQLREEAKDYAGAIEDYHKIREIESERKPKNNHTPGFSIAKTYRNWGADLRIAGEYSGAIDKFSNAIQLFEADSSDSDAWWSYWQRSQAFLALKDIERAKDDLLKAFDLAVSYYQADLQKNNKTPSYSIFERKGWPTTFDLLIDYAFVLFKALEDQEAAISLLEKHTEDASKLHFPIFFKRLVSLLIAGGRAEQANELLNKHRDNFTGDLSAFEERFNNPLLYRSKNEVRVSTEDKQALKDASSTALRFGHFDIAHRYLSVLENSPELSLDDRIFLCEGMGLLLERQWKYTASLKYYVELFQIREDQVTDERKIGEIKVAQRDFYQALDGYEGYFKALAETGETPTNQYVIDYAKVKEHLADYIGAMEILSTLGSGLEEIGFFYELKEKQAIKRHMLR